MKKTKSKEKRLKNEKTSKKNKKELKKLILPAILFLMFLGASIGYYLVFSTPSYTNDYEKIALKYVNYLMEKSNEKRPVLGARDYKQEDFYHVVFVFFSKNQGVPVYVTNDKNFVGHILVSKGSKNDLEAIKLAFTSLGFPIQGNLSNDLILVRNSTYKVYKFNTSNIFYKQLSNFYILTSNKHILLFALNSSKLE